VSINSILETVVGIFVAVVIVGGILFTRVGLLIVLAELFRDLWRRGWRG
jgi:hypothetical protein